MSSEGEAKIFLAEQRGRSESISHRSLHTFNFEKFNDANHRAFFGLTALNDETLMAGKIIEYKISSDSLICILPLIGGIQPKVDDGHEIFVEAGEAEIIFAKGGSRLQIRNPYEIESVNYLVLWLRRENKQSSIEKIPFDLDRTKNSIVRIFSSENANIYLGKFGGRADSEFTVDEKAKGLFAYVIEGAVEFDNRLLQQRDGLALWNKSKVEFESLSTETILMLVEV